MGSQKTNRKTKRLEESAPLSSYFLRQLDLVRDQTIHTQTNHPLDVWLGAWRPRKNLLSSSMDRTHKLWRNRALLHTKGIHIRNRSHIPIRERK